MTTRTKIFGTVVFLLSLIIGVQAIEQRVDNRKNEKKIQQLQNTQLKSLERIQKENQITMDSVEVLISDKNDKIKSIEKKLSQSIQKTLKTNIKYEKLKKNVQHITNPNSLENLLTKRYKNR